MTWCTRMVFRLPGGADDHIDEAAYEQVVGAALGAGRRLVLAVSGAVVTVSSDVAPSQKLHGGGTVPTLRCRRCRSGARV